ncbi:UTP--glucose-1-phosphate uridylyltransferase [Candidatus Dojkabacteria bacterium]|nr:UTP--glucose-1-phosphate uridylyltransferase [Candidatus Dojkabacteria bacterium]
MPGSGKITKAVITAAGYGTRFLPATKNVPKELLPVIDMPVLEYITEECVGAGITDIIIVTSYGKNAIEDYFDSSPELEEMLKKKGKTDLYKKVRNVYEKANFIFVRQSKHLPYGTAAPLLVVKNLIKEDEAFALLYGDDIYQNGKKLAIGELIETYKANRWCGAVIGAKIIPDEEVSNFGIFKYRKERGHLLFDEVVEKPSKPVADKNYTNGGRFVFNSEIFNFINREDYKENPRRELELTDVLNNYKRNNKMIIQEMKAEWYPAGKPIDMIRTTIKLALKRDDLKADVQKFINSLAN